jgi:hypothetical protein
MYPILKIRNGSTKEYTTMTYQVTHLSDVDNVGPLDRVNRIIVGTTLIAVTVMFTALPEVAIASIVAVGTYAGLTGFIGWDPLYALTKAFQRQAPATELETVATYQRPEEQPSAGSYKKAA